MEINKYLTSFNHNAGTIDRIKYIVIHYVSALGGARANCQYYGSGYIGASAHYYVDFDGSIWQSVEDKNIAWHCGAKSYVHPDCRNANSIGIEMCVRNKGSQADNSRDWYFEDATVKAAEELTRMLMEKYGIDADHVIRHYDVTGKICPNPYVYNHTKHTWADFKASLEKGSAVVILDTIKSGWEQQSDGGWRYYDNGKPVKDEWLQIGGRWYVFDGAGDMVTGWFGSDEQGWYYLNPADGAMLAGQWVDVKGKWYYMTKSGKTAQNAYAKSTEPDVYCWCGEDGAWQPEWDTAHPDLSKYGLVE